MIMQDALPGIKRFFKAARLEPWVEGYLICFIAGFVAHVGRMSASQAAQAVRTRARHRANVAEMDGTRPKRSLSWTTRFHGLVRSFCRCWRS